MVRNVAQSQALRTSPPDQSRATAARSVAALRMADGVEPSRTGKLDGAGQPMTPSWRKGWHANCRRFIAHQYLDGDESDEGDVWRIIDTEGLKIIGHADTKAKATLIADALEYLQLDTNIDEFDAAVAAV